MHHIYSWNWKPHVQEKSSSQVIAQNILDQSDCKDFSGKFPRIGSGKFPKN